MAKKSAKPNRPKLLSHTRPPTSHPTQSSKSAKNTRTTIRSYHTTQKRLSHALSTGDIDVVARLEAELAAAGGLEAYQAASTLGQSAQRGGDTSKVLVEWLQPTFQRRSNDGSQATPLRILEVGALSTTNALNIPKRTLVRRIDLRSNAEGIEEQDFMTLPPDEPWEGDVGYDIVSLSLVVNFVGDAKGRGEMLARTSRFLRVQPGCGAQGVLPVLFLVLPLPCVDNSRYLDEARLGAIMASLGYEKREVKRTSKLYYSLWRHNTLHSEGGEQRGGQFRKTEVRTGKDRNNFCIVLDQHILR